MIERRTRIISNHINVKDNWLQADEKGELSIAQYANADNPVAHGFKPILTFDVWEHAYYLDYQNRRAAHLAALWQIVNWEEIEKRYAR